MKKSFEEFSVAGKNQGSVTVLLALFASVIGASATLGIAEKTAAQGEGAIWFLVAGCAGLLLQGLLLSSKIRALDVNTLPELAEKTIGRTNALFISLIIFISWIGIVAAQFVALADIVSSLLAVDFRLVLVFAGAAVTAYTMWGGQGAVVKTARIHALFIFGGIAAAFVWCVLQADGAAGAQALNAAGALSAEGASGASQALWSADASSAYSAVTASQALATTETVSAFSAAFVQDGSFARFFAGVTPMSLVYLLFIVGGTYFLGPDIVSRNLISRDGRTARRAVLVSAGVLFVFAFLVVETSSFGAHALNADAALFADVASEDAAPVLQADTALSADVAEGAAPALSAASARALNPLVALIRGILPLPLAVILAVALISALISSADTCLVNAATIFEYNVLGKKRVGVIRALILVMGVAAVTLGLLNRGIMTLLVGAYAIYSPGVVLPLTIGILCYGKKKIQPRLMFAAIIVGSVCGLIAQFAPLPAVLTASGPIPLALVGMLLSGIIAASAAF